MPAARKTYFTTNDISAEQLETFIAPKHFLLNKVPVASAHLQAGCRMGSDPKSYITNPRGQVHGYPWLYVADGNLFPKSAHVNPYLTIMALADRVAEYILN